MREARLVKSVNSRGYTFDRVVRGPLNEKDKHWGMRSNLEFMEKLKPNPKAVEK